MDKLHTISWTPVMIFLLFHIVTSSDSPCPACFMLEQYTSGKYRQYVSVPPKITLDFQPGRHVLNVNHYFLASNLDFFTMKSISVTQVDCMHIRFDLIDFRSVQNVHISGITFSGCRCKIESVKKT